MKYWFMGKERMRACFLALLFGVICMAPAAQAASKPLVLNKKEMVLYPGVEGYDSFRLRVKKRSEIGDEPITFASSRPGRVTVTENGIVSALAKGKAKITVTAGDRSGVCRVTVKRPMLKLQSEKQMTLSIGGKQQIRISAVPSNAAVTFESSDPAVASVTKKGRVKGKAEGEAVITISLGTRKKRVAVTVKKATKASVETLRWNSSWKYAGNSRIHSSTVKLYHAANSNGIVVAVNAGHGTSGGSSVFTLCHPDGSLKVTGGSTAAGSKYADAVSTGTVFLDGTSEASANLSLAKILKTKLLEAGYDVLMIRESDDVQLDNIARTLFANCYADCHIALHYDSTTNDKGAYFMSVPDIGSYRSMQPVASNWRGCNRLGESVIAGMRWAGVKIDGSGSFPMDLTQTSYSTVPSIDVEVGDRGSSHSSATQTRIAKGIVNGVGRFFNK